MQPTAAKGVLQKLLLKTATHQTVALIQHIPLSFLTLLLPDN
jgi:hypothetical protein